MAAAGAYLLDTNIVLLATRAGSSASAAIDARFGLSQSQFRPAISEVSVGELLAFARSSKWGESRRQKLRLAIDQMLVIPISRAEIHARWAELYSHAKAKGLAIQHDHNDVWIGATASVAGMTLLSTDRKAFLPLRGTAWLDVIVIDPSTGHLVP